MTSAVRGVITKTPRHVKTCLPVASVVMPLTLVTSIESDISSRDVLIHKTLTFNHSGIALGHNGVCAACRSTLVLTPLPTTETLLALSSA